MKHNIIFIIISCFLILFSWRIEAADMACAFKNEKQAFDLRAMQSHLMVAALSCGERSSYNNFIKEHNSEFIQSGRYFKSYFRRNYKDDAERQMNKFITTLANESSKKSLDTSSSKFCAEASQIFSKIRFIRAGGTYFFAADKKFSGLHKISQCN